MGRVAELGTGRLRALLVEDDPVTLLLMRRWTEGEGFDVVGCLDAETASARPDLAGFSLAVVDWMLPGMDGLEFCRALRASPGGNEPVVLVVTARDGAQDLEAVLEAGADDYLAKPLEATSFVTRLKILVRQIRARREHRLVEEQFRHSQKMEAVGRLAGGVAHDFNNLLTAILGHCDLMLLRSNGEDPRYNDLLEIQKAGTRAALLTQQLLAFSRKQVLQPVVLDLNDAVVEMEKMLRRMIGEDIELVLRTSAESPRVKVDPGQMQQVIVNLAVNARDAMPGGGRLTVETRRSELGPEYCRVHAEARPGAYAVLSMTDTGVGMSEDVRSRLFEPFFTTKEVGKGTGLGLATVHGIVKQSGGHIRVSTEVGLGATFSIYLPCVDEEPPEAVAPTARDERRGTETILLVEDSGAVRGLARQILEEAGYRVLTAARGEEALELSRRGSARIDLLVTDVVMPGMDGHALASLLKAERPDLKVLYMSGYTDNTVIRSGNLPPGVSYLQKPFGAGAFTAQIRSLLDA